MCRKDEERRESGAAAGTGAAIDGSAANRRSAFDGSTDSAPSAFYNDLQILERREEPLTRLARLRAIEGPLLAWYGRRARRLPWRDDPQPYRVWVSEIMLQQTRVEAVKPYFERFMAAFPGISELAAADDDYLMKMWEGLGYYSRARNLKAAAGRVMEEYGGCLPASFEELKRLPGIGSYTAGAIASIAYGLAAPAVDGNVLRVIARLFGDRDDIMKPATRTRTEREIGEAMPHVKPGDYNQALIEVGALVCIPNGEPKCDECPLGSLCLARRGELWREIPVKAPKKERRIEERTVFAVCAGKLAAVGKRPPRGLLASLYELPNVLGWPKEGEELRSFAARALGVSESRILSASLLPDAKHIFSHVEWHMKGVLVELDGEDVAEDGELSANWELVPAAKLKTVYALPKAFAAYAVILEGRDSE